MADLNNDGVVDEKDVEVAKGIATTKAAEAKKALEDAYAKAQAEGFFSHFAEYNVEILKPAERFKGADVKESLLAVKDEALATVMLKPSDPAAGFVFYNVLALVLGIAESIIFAIFGHGLFSLIWNGAIGYIIAYTMYWTMVCSGKKPYMFYTLCFLALYVVFNVYMAVSTLLYVIPACLYGAKAFVDVLQLICGFELYKKVAGDKLML